METEGRIGQLSQSEDSSTPQTEGVWAAVVDQFTHQIKYFPLDAEGGMYGVELQSFQYIMGFTPHPEHGAIYGSLDAMQRWTNPNRPVSKKYNTEHGFKQCDTCEPGSCRCAMLNEDANYGW